MDDDLDGCFIWLIITLLATILLTPFVIRFIEWWWVLILEY